MTPQDRLPSGLYRHPGNGSPLAPNSVQAGRSAVSAPVLFPQWAQRPAPAQPLMAFDLAGRSRVPPVFVGTAIAAEPVHYERPGFRLPAVLHRLLLLAEFIALPVILLRWWMSYAGAASLLVSALALFLFFRYLMPGNLLSMVWMARLFNPRRSEDQVPVRYIRLRADDGREVAIRIEGRVTGANMMAGDTLAVWGSLRRGTLNLRRAVNLNTGAESRVHPGGSWFPLVVNLIVLGVLMGLFAGPLLSTMASSLVWWGR